jgi:hypothetical protein
MQTKRLRSIREAQRERILERDGRICVYCHKPANSVDHVIPYSYNGNNTDSNLVACCLRCNSIAGSQIFDSLAQKAAYIRATLERKGERLGLPIWQADDMPVAAPKPKCPVVLPEPEPPKPSLTVIKHRAYRPRRPRRPRALVPREISRHDYGWLFSIRLQEWMAVFAASYAETNSQLDYWPIAQLAAVSQINKGYWGHWARAYEKACAGYHIPPSHRAPSAAQWLVLLERMPWVWRMEFEGLYDILYTGRPPNKVCRYCGLPFYSRLGSQRYCTDFHWMRALIARRKARRLG